MPGVHVLKLLGDLKIVNKFADALLQLLQGLQLALDGVDLVDGLFGPVLVVPKIRMGELVFQPVEFTF